MKSEFYVEKDGAFYVWSDKNKEYSEYVCRALHIENILIDCHSHLCELCVSFQVKDGSLVEIILPKGSFAQNAFLKPLVERGLDILDSGIAALKKILREEEKKARVSYGHRCLGFSSMDELNVYYLDASQGTERESVFLGEQNVWATGSEERWLETVKKQMQGNISLQIALAVGFSAPLVAKLNAYSNTDNLLVSLVGRTSTGKTTALKLMASIWGRPDFTQEGILSSFNATVTAHMRQLANKIGFPAFIDESTSLGNDRDWSRNVYELSNGIEKERCDSSLQLKERFNWLTTITITSERSMLDCVANDGVKIRLIELPLKFFKSAALADEMKTMVQRNYGHFGRKFIQYVISLSDEELYEKYDQAVQTLMRWAKSPQDSARIRLIRKLAVFLMVAELVNQAQIGLFFAVKRISVRLAKIEKMALKKRRNIADDAFEYLKNKIAENYLKFIRKEIRGEAEERRCCYSTIGKIIMDAQGNIQYVWILTNTVKDFLGNSEFSRKMVDIFAAWIAEGKLVHTDKGRKDTKRMLCGIKQRVMIFRLSQESKELSKLKQVGSKKAEKLL